MSADRAELATRERVALRCGLPLEEGSAMSSRSKPWISLAVAVGLAGAADDAGASPITFGISGEVLGVSVNFGTSDIAVGDPVDIFYTFDSDAPDQASSPEFGLYALSALEIHVGPETLVASQPIAAVGGEIGVSMNGFYSVLAADLPGFRNGVPLDQIELYIEVRGEDESWPPSDDLLVVPPSLDDVDVLPMLLAAIEYNEEEPANSPPVMAWQVDFTVESFYLVPEVSTGGLLSFSLAVWALSTRRRPRRD
jgi:hypothetical protein